MPTRIRGQEIALKLIVDGVLQEGSFTKVTDFEITPRSDLVESDFLGELETDIDIAHHGFDFSFTVDEADGKVMDLLYSYVTNEQERVAHPDINILVIEKFRSLTEPSKMYTLEKCILKMDSHSFGGRKEYVKSKFSGKCKTIAEVI